MQAHLVAADATIEDACSYAWCQLVRRTDITLDDRAAGWLYTVAIHEGWRLAALERATVSYSPGFDDRKHVRTGVPEPASLLSVENLVAARLRLDDLRELPERERRALVLSALGLSYAEIAEHTAVTVRTVDRLLRRATQRIRSGTSADVPPSERAVVACLATGAPVDAVADELGVTAQTVREHTQSACRRLGVATLALAIVRLRSAPH